MSNLVSVDVKFEDSQYNYSTSMNGRCSDHEIQAYFVGERLDRGVFPKENFQKCIGVTISR